MNMYVTEHIDDSKGYSYHGDPTNDGSNIDII